MQPSDREFRVLRGDSLELTFAVPAGKAFELTARSPDRSQEVTATIQPLAAGQGVALEKFMDRVAAQEEKVFDFPDPLPGNPKTDVSTFRIKVRVGGTAEAPDDPAVVFTLRVFVPQRPPGQRPPSL